MFHYGKLDTNDTIEEIVSSYLRIDDGDHVFLSAEPDFTGESYIGRSWPRPSIPWKTISRRQGRQQLIIDELDEQVQAIIDAIPDIKQRKLTQAWFDFADPWERNNAYLISLGEQLGLTSIQVDDMFKAAVQL